MKWTQGNELPERKDLEVMYRAVVAPGCKDMVIMTLTSGELIKAICRATYYHYLDIVPKWKIIYFLSEAFGASQRAIDSYLPRRPQKYINVRQLDERGVRAEFETVGKASDATGIPRENIISSIQSGCRAYAFRFEADIFKPVIR